MTTATVPLGILLRDWRRRRRLGQLDLALEAGVSARHLSFLETGRSNPSREMVLHLCEQLDVPLRDRNRLLLAAGYAPADQIAVPLRFDAGGRELAFFSTIATFGTAIDITLAELAIEAFFPADPETAAYLRGN